MAIPRTLKAALLKKRSAKSDLFVFLDYDGTLTPIVKTPKDATLSAANRTLIHSIAKQNAVSLAIVSGRKLSEVKGLVRIPGIIYAGNHGLEVKGPRFSLMNKKAKASVPLLRELEKVLSKKLKPFKGAFVENKHLTLSIHFRLSAPRFENDIKRIVLSETQTLRKRGLLKLTKGKCVLEVRPNTDWNKGLCVKWLLSREKNLKNMLPIYIGDDKTDEAAFSAVNARGGISILVSKSPQKTKAKFRLSSPADVMKFLRVVKAGS